MTDLLLLATLLDGPKHGYQLKKQAGMIFGQGAIHNNLVYPLLRRFTEEGWVSKKTAKGERGQTKQLYAITAAGRKALVDRLSEFDEDSAQAEDGFRIRVALLSMLRPEAQANILASRERALASRNAHLTKIQQSVALSLYPDEVVKFLRAQIAHERAWIRSLEKLRTKERLAKGDA